MVGAASVTARGVETGQEGRVDLVDAIAQTVGDRVPKVEAERIAQAKATHEEIEVNRYGLLDVAIAAYNAFIPPRGDDEGAA